MVFVFFSVLFCVYICSFCVTLLFEFPFRTLVKVLLCPPKKILKLKKDLAKQLQTFNDPLFGDELDDEDETGHNLDEKEKRLSEETNKKNKGINDKSSGSSEDISDRE